MISIRNRESGAVAGPMTSPISANSVSMLDTRSVPRSDRLEFWRAHVDAANGLRIECPDDDFRANMVQRSLGDMCAIHALHIKNAHRAVRQAQMDNLVFANLQLENQGARFSGHREFAMPAGSLVLYDAANPYELDFGGMSDSLVLALPKSELQRRVTDLNVHLDEALEYDTHKVTMLAGLLKGIMDMPANLRQSVADSLAESVLNLLVATLYGSQSTGSQMPTHGTAATLRRIKAFINENIADPNLCPAMVAEAEGITVSYLHKIFVLNNSTMMQAVMAERLERCRRDIAKLDRARGISQVGYSWGFNDASHFSRSFRKRFGVSPREYQMQVRAQDEKLDPHTEH